MVLRKKHESLSAEIPEEVKEETPVMKYQPIQDKSEKEINPNIHKNKFQNYGHEEEFSAEVSNINPLESSE
jgi:hypothetical protein